jgi:hypothetical protein
MITPAPTMNSAAAPLLEQVGEDGHERRRERGVGEQVGDEVRDLKGDRVRRGGAAGAEVARGDDFADQSRDPRDPCGGREDRRVARDPPTAGMALVATALALALAALLGRDQPAVFLAEARVGDADDLWREVRARPSARIIVS